MYKFKILIVSPLLLRQKGKIQKKVSSSKQTDWLAHIQLGKKL